MTGQPLPALPARVLPLNLQRDLPRRILDGQCRQDRRYRAIRLANIQPGDWLWVREPYRLPAALDGIAPSQVALRFDDPEIHFSADGPAPPGFGASRIGYTLPRAFSRMVLCVTARRIAPVQQWTADDARAMLQLDRDF